MGSIKLLADSVQSTIRSGVVITSMARCVEELVLNSVDAKASRIFINIDLDDFNLEVDDDGHGISRDDMELIGTRYATNKCHTVSDLTNLKYYGYRGEALANIIDLSSSVEIYSQFPSLDRDREVYYRKFKLGKPHGPVQRISTRKRSSHGVTVIIQGFLSRLPVRQRQIGNLEVEHIKKFLERIYIMNPTLRIDFKNQVHRILQTVSLNSSAEAFQKMYNKSLNEVSLSYGRFCFQGWFSTELHPSKSLQLVYVNKRYTSRNAVHRALDEILTEVLGTKKRPDTEKHHAGGKREKMYPVFVLNIVTPLTEYDVTLDPAKSTVEFKNLDLVLEGVEALKVLFQATLRSCNRNDLLANAGSKMSNAELNVNSTSDSLPQYGKSVSSRAFKTAIHGNVVKRVTSGGESPMPTTDNTNNSQGVKNGSTKSNDRRNTNGSRGPMSDVDPNSKMAKYKKQDKPKIQRHTETTTETTLTTTKQTQIQPESQEQVRSESKSSKKRTKRKSELPLFPKEYNKRLRTASQLRLNSGNQSALLDKIKELFPVFREEGHDKNSRSKPPRLSQEESSNPSPLPPSVQFDNEFSQNGRDLHSPFQRLCLTRENAAHSSDVPALPHELEGGVEIQIQGEGMWDPPSRFSSLSSGTRGFPRELSDDHFCRLVDNHLGEVRKNLGLQDLAEHAANTLRQIIKHHGQKGTGQFRDQGEEPKQRRQGRISLDDDTESVVSSISSFTPAGDIQIMNPVKQPPTTAEIIDSCRRNHNDLNYSNRNLITSGPSNFWPENEVRDNDQFSEQRRRPIHNGLLMNNRPPDLDTPRIISSEYRFEKEDLKRMMVIGQVDNKFIVAKSTVNQNNALVLFDQHAVHERIRLEKLLEECRERSTDDSIAAPIRRVVISPPIQLELTDTELRVVGTYWKHFENNGIQIEVGQEGPLVLVHTAPVCFLDGGDDKRYERVTNLLQRSIQHQVRYILETNGLMQQIPQETYELLCSRACRGAIKFGDSLTREVCQELIVQLAECNSPFQCAHGRPVLTPILDLSSVPGTPVYRAEVSCFVTNKT